MLDIWIESMVTTGTVYVVFNGYLHDVSRKNQEQIRKGSTSAANVTVRKRCDSYL